ncbi:hypothetical protein F2Q70_00018806 [Brassica cretica]|uniref:Uncharacterized protein n=1 Tax=Brassica cretica TaxID=69181 RepID=A0A8S9HNN8_BRACR|nr:hypothetical protein F2Q70_00018806 [Brassica cretica]
MVRTPCCKEEGIKKGAWTPEEDQKLIAYLQLHGEGGWRTLPEKAGLKRCGKSCRLRWANYLRPDIKRGEFTPEEDDTIIKLHALMGNKWAAIASSLAGRTDNDIKNYWNTNLKKRLKQKGLDPITHKPINPTGFEPVNHKLGSSGSARLLNRVAKKYAVDVKRDLLTGIIIGNSTIIAEDSQNSSDTEHSTSTLLKTVAKPSAPATSPGSFSDDLDVFFSNEEISDMYMNVDNVGLMEELKSILSYAGDIKDSPEYNVSDEMEFLDSWNEEDGLDLENCLDPITHKPINPTGFEPVNHKLGSSGSARLLNRVAKKYAVDVKRDLLTGIIIGNSTIIAEDSQNSSDTEHSTSTLLKTVAKPSAPATSPGSFSDDLDVFFSNEEISDMYMNVDNVGLMEELKSILSYAGDIKDSPEYNVSDEMEFLDSWNEEDGLDLENCL